LQQSSLSKRTTFKEILQLFSAYESRTEDSVLRQNNTASVLQTECWQVLGLLVVIVANPFILLTQKGMRDMVFCNFEVNSAVVK